MGRSNYCMTGPPTRTTKEQVYTSLSLLLLCNRSEDGFGNANVFFGIFEKAFRNCFLKLNLMHVKYY